MAVAWVSKTFAVNSGTDTSLTAPRPSGLVDGQLLLAVVTATYDGGGTMGACTWAASGWTTLYNVTDDTSAATMRTMLLYKLLTNAAAEPSGGYQASVSGSFNQMHGVGVHVFSGTDLTTPINVSSSLATGTTQNATATAVTTTAADCLVCTVRSVIQTSGASRTLSSADAGTERDEYGAADDEPLFVRQAVYTSDPPHAVGTNGAFTVSASGSVSAGRMFSVAVAPPVGVPAGLASATAVGHKAAWKFAPPALSAGSGAAFNATIATGKAATAGVGLASAVAEVAKGVHATFAVASAFDATASVHAKAGRGLASAEVQAHSLFYRGAPPKRTLRIADEYRVKRTPRERRVFEIPPRN